MKQSIKKISLTLLAAALIAPAGLLAQQKEEKDKELKEKEKKDVEQIVITRKGNKEEKIVVEVTGEKILVNGKEIKDNDGDVTVRRNKIKDVWAYGGNTYSWNGNQNFNAFSMDENRAMLGVTTEKAEGGAVIEEITKESAAEKAGLKKGDVIKKINDSKVEDPDDLSAAIKKQKPGDKVTVTYLRDKKEQTLSAELTKWKGVNVYTTFPSAQGFHMDMDKLDFEIPRVRVSPQVRAYGYSSGRGPKLGISVQDAEDGKGVKVLEVEDDGNAAKAGLKKGDTITEVDGKAVNSADEVAKGVREGKDKVSVKMKLLRAGKVQTVEVKIPRKLKTADL